MPKDATKNIDRYKIRGGQLNEFDFAKNQEQFAEQGTRKATKSELIGNAARGGGAQAGKAAKGAGAQAGKAAKGAGNKGSKVAKGAGTKAGKAAKGAGNKGSKAAKGAGAKKRGKK